MIPDSESLPSFYFTHWSYSTCVGLKHKKRKCKKLIKDSETQSHSLILSSRLPGFFSLPNALYCQETKFQEACKIFPWWALPRQAQPHILQWGTHTPLTSAGVSPGKTNEGFSPKNISFLRQMNPLDRSAEESVLFKRFLEGT